MIGSGGLLGEKDAVGAANYAAFIGDFVPQYLAKYRAGTLPANALNLKDPDSMISQSLGQGYQRSMVDRMKDSIARNGGIGSTQTTPSAAPAKISAPPALSGIPNLRFHAETNQFSDPATGAVYDNTGKLEVPATKDRPAGTAYRTPKGKMTWTGNGWAVESGPAPPTSR